jgi:membrane-bound serine protease (ClpP class)
VGRTLILTVLLFAQSTAVGGQPATDTRPLVVVAEYDGIIHPIAAEYFAETIDAADTGSAALVVFVLRTPGGLLDSTRDIVSRMIRSRAPVAVLVAPSGARAASAGFIIAIAADVMAMATGTHIGAAHPVSGSGEQPNDTVIEKAASDAAAYVRSLAKARGRNIMLAEEAVLRSRAFTDSEAIDASPPLADLRAPGVSALVRALHGRTVTRFDGRSQRLSLDNAEISRREPTWRQRALGALAHPQIAYLLLTLGMLGLTIELWNPGTTIPGVVGGICLLLAFFALQIIPVGTAGVLLVLLGMTLLVLELMVPSFGVLGIGGTISLLLGSVMMTRAVPGVEVSHVILVPVVLVTAALVLFLGRLGLRAQRLRPVTGGEGLIGLAGRVRMAVDPDAPGQVDVRGEIWRARSLSALAPGTPVRIVGREGLTLTVEPLDEARQGDDRWTG